VNDPGEHEVLRTTGRREAVVRLNSLCSFTDDPERAWEFGSTVWEARVPLPRVFLAPDVFPRSILRGEREWIVVGGETRVRRVLA
jgi:NAD+--dinitrogen-reductase ADP-D-ribosyltransferase